MAVYSMTGYAERRRQVPRRCRRTPPPSTRVVAEMRSVNGRFLDLSLLPDDELRGLEPTARTGSPAFRRSKVELRIATREQETPGRSQPDQLNRLSRLDAVVQELAPGRAPSASTGLHWCSKTGGSRSMRSTPRWSAARAAIAARARARGQLRRGAA